MARPLRFDEQFATAINEQIDEKFLNLITIKVPKTAFYKNLSLQTSLIICSTLDITIGLTVFYFLFEEITAQQEDFLFFIENIFLIFGICFGILGIDSAVNLKKTNSYTYKYWKIFITLSILSIEIFRMITENFCYFSLECSRELFLTSTMIYLVINIYMIKISWSFCVRIEKNHVLLIIHGKHLEKILSDDNYVIKDYNKFIPNEMKISNLRNYYQEKELINIASDHIAMIDEEMFAPKKINPFIQAEMKGKVQNENY